MFKKDSADIKEVLKKQAEKKEAEKKRKVQIIWDEDESEDENNDPD